MSANRRVYLPKLEPVGWRVARSAPAAVSRPRSSPIKRFVTFSGHLRSGWQRGSEADGHGMPRGKRPAARDWERGDRGVTAE